MGEEFLPFQEGCGYGLSPKEEVKSEATGQANAVKLKGHSVARARAFEFSN